MESTLTLKPGRERSVLQRHPWIFSGAVLGIRGDPQMGETVSVFSSDGTALGKAAFSPQSNIRARMWSFGSEVIGPDFFQNRLKLAIERREKLFDQDYSAARLVYAESDGLPGVLVDRYGNTLVFQFLSAGAERWRDILVEQALLLTGCKDAYERSDVDIRTLEGLQERTGVLAGQPAEVTLIRENGLTFRVDIHNGHKTGFYLDQRLNRRHLQALVQGRDVLNCFCYTGAFTVYALAGGARHVLSVDSSADALALGRQNLSLNNLAEEKADWLEGDVFKVLRLFRDQNQKFDAIILDPPKFAPTFAHAEKAARGYKDINLLAFKLLRPGGLLFTFSCSGGISPDLFQKILAGAALDAGVEVRILQHLFQSPDHPMTLQFPEGLYLKGLVVEI
jgi:23S rRNA (cytosine1962-C5)-methyltransferase